MLAIAAAAALVLALVVGNASAPSADAGRGRLGACEALGLEEATNIYPIADGSYGFSVYGAPHKVALSNVTNTSFDWSSSVGIDAVVVKSWFNGDVYTYDEAVEDTGLKTSKYKQAIFCLDTDEEAPAVEATNTPSRKSPPVATEPLVAPPEKCTDRKGCPTATPGITPEEETEKCTDRKGCPTPPPPG